MTNTDRRFAIRAGGILVALLAGLILHSWFLVGGGLVGALTLILLRVWRRRDRGGAEASAWTIAGVFGLLAVVLIALAVYAVGFTGGSLVVGLVALCAVVPPIAYFATIAWAAIYFALTGRRAPQVGRLSAICGRLSEPVFRRGRRS